MTMQIKMIVLAGVAFVVVIALAVGLKIVKMNSTTDSIVNTNTEDIEQAEAALKTFMELLYTKQYAAAAEQRLDSDFLTTLRDYNPDTNPNDIANLLKGGCEANGFVCRPIRTVITKKQIAKHTYVFTVELADENGDVYIISRPSGVVPITQPDIQVSKQGGVFVIGGLPYIS